MGHGNVVVDDFRMNVLKVGVLQYVLFWSVKVFLVL